MNHKHEPPISTEKTPDDVRRIAVRASLSPRRGKSVGEIAKMCDLSLNTVRRHLRNLIKIGYARQLGRGSGTKYLSSSPGKRSRRTISVSREQIGQAEQALIEVRKHLLSNVRKYKARRIAQAAAYKQAHPHADAQGRTVADD